ncbi:MAG TPA: cytochrome c biogenesis protein CcsA [Sandaracinaceae bacterium LLY-WYZ-13_1]|nr:cytochrome c biogenesis protein CcsA [Sandaracinaceae bacterium LLY-WYZ-13_1]
MLVTVLFALTVVAYAASAGLYVLFLARGTEGGATWAARVLGGAVACHVGFLVGNWVIGGHLPTDDIHQALAVMSLLVVLLFLIAARSRKRLQVLGAFITPVTLLLFLGAAFRRGVGPVPEGVRSALLPVHVGVNILGLAAFALAFAAAVAYVIQERQLRQKKLGGLMQRLPALDVLDSLGLRWVLIGFPLLTVGVVTGTIWAVRLNPHSFGLSAAQGFGLLAWLLFALVLLLRVAAGWRGRKAAIGTMLGFLCTVLVLVGYLLRGVGGIG